MRMQDVGWQEEQAGWAGLAGLQCRADQWPPRGAAGRPDRAAAGVGEAPGCRASAPGPGVGAPIPRASACAGRKLLVAW